MNFGLIGASKTGLAMAYHLWQKGYQPLFLWNRSPENLQKSRQYLPFEQLTASFQNLAKDCDFILFSVSDDALEAVIRDFFLHHKNTRVKLFHTSGAIDSSVFGKYENSGSMHPVISISTVAGGIENLPQTTFTCEGKIAPFLKNLAETIGETGIILTGEQKQNLHLSAVFLNNYLKGLIEKIKILNQTAGLEVSKTQKILDSITRQTLAESWREPLAKTLTGPVKRGDVQTIKKHLDILKNDYLFQQLYKIFGNILLNFVNQDKEKTKILKKLFKLT
ncbi:MAG: DUF2520 domain-containing protein [Candidatus Marinimicrobia bacterium]|nr:DUF2520 domain-containing protein [Candidatus Neomarinimicrobiota bacterium]